MQLLGSRVSKVVLRNEVNGIGELAQNLSLNFRQAVRFAASNGFSGKPKVFKSYILFQHADPDSDPDAGPGPGACPGPDLAP